MRYVRLSWRFGLLLLLIVATLVLIGCESTETGLTVGKKAPDFELYDLDGNIHKLSDYKGQPVILNFWATWCGYCRIEMPYFEEIYNEWKDDDLILFAVNVGESSSLAKSFMDYYGYTIPVLLDSAKTVNRKYAISGYPTTYFIDEGGIIQDRIPGAFPDLESLEKYVIKLFE